MASPETEELIEQVNRLITTTSGGEIIWTRANPTTFTWERGSPAARIILQTLTQSRTVVVGARPVQRQFRFLLFQVVDPLSKETYINVQERDDTDVGRKLAELYQAISASESRRGLDFLKSVLP